MKTSTTLLALAVGLRTATNCVNSVRTWLFWKTEDAKAIAIDAAVYESNARIMKAERDLDAANWAVLAAQLAADEAEFKLQQTHSTEEYTLQGFKNKVWDI